MIKEPPVLRLKHRKNRPNLDQIGAFQGVPSSFVSDALNGNGSMAPQIKPIDPQHKLPLHIAGPALTVDCPPADNLGVVAALLEVQSGDIMVVATLGHLARAVVGDLVIGMMKNKGGIGFVTDGALRDMDGLRRMGIGCWGAGLTPASPFSTGPGAVGYPITLGGQTVQDGDMIVADEDGVVVVPFDQIDATIAQLGMIKTIEAERDAAVANGLSIPPHAAALLASDRIHRDD